MKTVLKGTKVAILVTDGFEQDELTKPKKALERAGAETQIVSPFSNKVRGWKNKKWGKQLAVDRILAEADPSDYDALLLPGGVMNPDRLRMDPNAVNFVKHFVDSNKPIAAICHGPWTLIETGAVDGVTLTSWPSLRTDIANAGGNWVDEEVVVDQGIITSRRPDDIPAFNSAMIAEFGRVGQTPSLDRRTA